MKHILNFVFSTLDCLVMTICFIFRNIVSLVWKFQIKNYTRYFHKKQTYLEAVKYCYSIKELK